MRGTLLRLAVGLALVFSLDCGSSSGDGTGGSGGQAGLNGGGGHPAAGRNGGGGHPAAGTDGGGGHPAAGTNGGGGHPAAGTDGGGGHPAAGTDGGGGHPAAGTDGGGGHPAGGGAGGAAGHPAGGTDGGGGHPAGGAAGGGGATGTGGQGGSAGHAAGGQGGQSIDSGISCADLASEYAAATPAADACTPGGTNQCQTLMPRTLACPGCDHYVNDATTLKAIQAQWTAQGCNLTTALTICPLAAVACISPGSPGNCVATDSAAPGGVCSAGILTPL